MFFEVLIFLSLGIVLGVLFGIAPGIHPNMIILLIPLFMTLSSSPLAILALIVSMAVVNVLVDFIPSILFGAPDPEAALSVLPGHRMLMNGEGYTAIKLAVIGGLGAVLFCIALLPVIILTVPNIYELSKPVIPFILMGFVGIMVFASKKKILSIVCFFLAGTIGMLSFNLPVDNVLVLFPIFSGFFGLPVLLLQMKSRTRVPEQNLTTDTIEKAKTLKPVVLGSLGGIVSGILPGIGSSEIAGLATIEKNNRSFLMTLGAIAVANILLSFLALWLIGNPRSGVAVAVQQIMKIGMNEFLFIVVIALISAAVGALLTLFLSKKIIPIMEKIDYSLVSKLIFALILIMVFYFTGVLGLFLAGLCCALGIFVNITEIKRGLLMGVLILPTILFYFGI